MLATKWYGLKPLDIGLMSFKELHPYHVAYQKEQKDKSDMMKISAWWNGVYTLNAINSSAMGQSQWYMEKNHKPIEYPKKPYDLEEKQPINPDISEEIAILKMKNQIDIWAKQGLPEAPD